MLESRISNAARVFISCGQARGSEEEKIAREIAERVRNLGFDPYVAVTEQTLRGLRENIFEQLRSSEYFIFVDFKRERLANPETDEYRGSLFSHQELSIASFLELDVIALQESGVKPDDGIIRFLQANAIRFTDRHTLPNVIADKIRERNWDPGWQNELILERDGAQFSDARRPDDLTGRYFHINVHNRHHTKTAQNCYVYLENAEDLGSGESLPLKIIEFKWAGTMLPGVGIAPLARRPFDAFFILHNLPTVVQVNSFSDSTEFLPRISGEGRYKLTYLVVSNNFHPVRGTFVLNLNATLDQTSLLPSA
ncbi:MAG TPA: hypothetical protein VMF53_10265 [Alphaproteobacteria bacterium]|nr:hypothetical protein [Alphaproteobacteria bacterium]